MGCPKELEVARIELATRACKAHILPLNYTSGPLFEKKRRKNFGACVRDYCESVACFVIKNGKGLAVVEVDEFSLLLGRLASGVICARRYQTTI